MNPTLPLFDGLVDGPDAGRNGGAARDAGQERHLRAALRLSRSMWRYPDHSPQQTRAGLAICHHLQALLAQSEDQSAR